MNPINYTINFTISATNAIYSMFSNSKISEIKPEVVEKPNIDPIDNIEIDENPTNRGAGPGPEDDNYAYNYSDSDSDISDLSDDEELFEDFDNIVDVHRFPITTDQKFTLSQLKLFMSPHIYGRRATKPVSVRIQTLYSRLRKANYNGFTNVLSLIYALDQIYTVVDGHIRDYKLIPRTRA